MVRQAQKVLPSVYAVWKSAPVEARRGILAAIASLIALYLQLLAPFSRN